MNQKLKPAFSNSYILLFLCLMLALAVRLPGLTTFLTADEARSWFGRSIIFLDALSRGDWANTAPNSKVAYIENVSLSPAPGVTTMAMGAIGLLWEYWRQGATVPLSQFLQTIPFDPLEPTMLFSLRLPGVLVAVLAVGLTFWWSRPLLGESGAFLTATLLALDPFQIALSRVLGHDALVATFMWLSLLAILDFRFWILDCSANPKSKIQNLIVSAIFAALAALSKYPALFIAPFIALTILSRYLWHVSRNPTSANLKFYLSRFMLEMTIWSSVMAVTFILLWPAMWVHPINLPTTIISDALRASGSPHQKGSFFWGQPVPDPGGLFYPMVALFRTTPLVIIMVLLGFWRMENKATRLIFIFYIIFYMLLITFGGKKQDRYLLPIFPALDFLAAVGYVQFIQKFGFLQKRKILFYSLPVILQAMLILPTYPYYFSYYNQLLGGAPTAAQYIQVGWGEGLNEAADYLNSLPNANSRKVVSWYSTTFEPYFHGQTIYKIDESKISRSPKPGLAADNVVFYINQTQRDLPSDGALAYFRQSPPIYTVMLNGLEYGWVYPAPAVTHIINDQTRLVGQAELLGFDGLTENGQRLTALPVGKTSILRLYWEWQGKTSAEIFKIELVDNQGQPHSRGQLLTSDEDQVKKQDGAIIISNFAFTLSPDIPVGQYYLKFWLDRPSKQESVGQFPLSPTDAAVSVE